MGEGTLVASYYTQHQQVGIVSCLNGNQAILGRNMIIFDKNWLLLRFLY